MEIANPKCYSIVISLSLLPQEHQGKNKTPHPQGTRGWFSRGTTLIGTMYPALKGTG